MSMDQEELLYQGEPNEDALLADNSDDFNDPDRTAMESELEAIKARVKEMEDEAEKIRQIQTEADEKMSTPAGGGAAATIAPLSIEEKMEADLRSIYVGNVDYGATAEELEQHFHGCGAVNRVTIQCNKFDGHPKGFAYIEFSDKDSVGLAMTLDESLFRGRQLKVMPKRTNKPGLSSSNRFPRGRGRGRRNASRLAASLVAAVMQSTMRPPRRSRGRRFHYSPY